MKSFNKILSLVLALTMMVSLVAVPSAYAAIKYPVGDTSDYEVAVSFVDAAGTTEVTKAEAGATVYLRLDFKNFSTLNTGFVTVNLEGATFASQTDMLTGSVFAMDPNQTIFSAGSKTADYGLKTDVANLTSTNKKVKYYAFPEPTDMYLALYKLTVDEEATEVTATVAQNLKLGDANGATGNIAATAEGIILTNDSLTVGSPTDYSYTASWSDVTTANKVFPENTTEDEIKAAVKVTKTTYSDGVETGTEVMEEGYRVVLNDGTVTVTIDGDLSANVTCGLTYTIEQITYRYDAFWTVENAFDYGTSEAAILSKVEVKKYTITDGVEDDGVVITTGYAAEAKDGVVTITIDGIDPITLDYSIIGVVEYKNEKLNASTEYEYTATVEDIKASASVTIEKWVNDALDSTITLVPDEDYELKVIFDENYNDGRIDVTLIGDYINFVAPQSVIFERINPPITYGDITAELTEEEFSEIGLTEDAVAATVVVKAMKKVGNLAAEEVTLVRGVDYAANVDLTEKEVVIDFITIVSDDIKLAFDIIPAPITYANAVAVISDSVFGNVPEAADIIARLTVTADKYKGGVADGTVTITSDNYDVQIGENVATITFKGVFAELDAVEVEFSVEEVAYGDPSITVDGIISGDGKDDAAIIEEAWTLITATRDVLTNGIVTDSEELDAAALKELGVEAEIVDGKVVFTYNSAVLAEISVSAGKLQFASANPKTAATEFIKFATATLKNIFDNLKIKKDVFQIIELNAGEDEWETLTKAIENGDATVTVDGVTYDNSNLADAGAVLVEGEDSVSLEVVYNDVESAIEVSLLNVATDYANEEDEKPVVSITTDATQVQTGTDVTATVYVSGLTGNIETGSVSLLFSNAEVVADDIVASNGFEILSKTVDANEIKVVFTINDAAYDAGAGIFKVTFDTTNSDVNAKLGLAINEYALTRIVDMGGYNEYKPVNATIGDNVEVTVTAEDVPDFDYEVSYASGKTSFYTDAEAVADVKVIAYPTINGVRDPEQPSQDVTTEASINANNGVITVDKDGKRVTTLTYTIYEVAFDQTVAIETIGSVDDAKFTENVAVSLDGANFDDAVVALDGRNIKVSVAGIKAEGTYVIDVAVPGYTKATVNVVVSKKATLDGYDAKVVTGSKIYAGDINGDNRIDAVDFSDVAGKYGQAKETKYDLYTGNTSATIDNLDVTTMAHYFITLARGQVSADGTTITPYSGN